jgi:hypothetical protein
MMSHASRSNRILIGPVLVWFRLNCRVFLHPWCNKADQDFVQAGTTSKFATFGTHNLFPRNKFIFDLKQLSRGIKRKREMWKDVEVVATHHCRPRFSPPGSETRVYDSSVPHRVTNLYTAQVSNQNFICNDSTSSNEEARGMTRLKEGASRIDTAVRLGRPGVVASCWRDEWTRT